MADHPSDSETEFAARLENDLGQFWHRLTADDKFYGEYQRPKPPVISETETVLASVRKKRPEEDELPEERRLIGTAPPTGACCCPGDPSCFITDQASCEACCPVCEFQGPGTECDPNPCGGACCNHAGCQDALDEDDCINRLGGVYQGDGVVCDPSPCPPGACCRPTDPYCDCIITDTEDDCSNIGGTYHEGITCEDDPRPCPSICGLSFYLYTHSICNSPDDCDASECGPDCYTVGPRYHCVGPSLRVYEQHYVTVGSGCPGTGDVSFTDFIATIHVNQGGDPPDTWIFEYDVGCLGSAGGIMTLGSSPIGTWDINVVGDGNDGTVVGMTYSAQLVVTGDEGCLFS